ncbi:hypothetical protein C2S51_026284 [Perilla frutescens var. frutescens]|nr:hypothetical protein C2S51_026284 [Perilla frutescens var. frutescens]
MLHPLVLVPSPTYCSGSFLCNACGAPGTAFSYCCTLCEVDLHLHCAFLPPKLTHSAHHHELRLSFGGSERLSSSDDHCKICAKELSSEHWSYFCGSDACFFRVHTFCATGEVQPRLREDDQKTGAWQPRVETGLTPEEEIVLEMSRMKMELQMAQSLAEIIAYPHLI